HALKGAAASVMATVVREGAARIESHVQGGDFDAAAAEVAALDARMRACSAQRALSLTPSHHNHAIDERIGIKLAVDHVVAFRRE
ncbi:MAG: hypothetical protein Q8R61_14900, partial [Thiobacillus sp.]|nr:hypothetical protein [Thiobacillus sp.]